LANDSRTCGYGVRAEMSGAMPVGCRDDRSLDARCLQQPGSPTLQTKTVRKEVLHRRFSGVAGEAKRRARRHRGRRVSIDALPPRFHEISEDGKAGDDVEAILAERRAREAERKQLSPSRSIAFARSLRLEVAAGNICRSRRER